MKTASIFLAIFSLPLFIIFAQNAPPPSPRTFPNPDFRFHDKGAKEQKSGVVLGPM